jgi:CRISPR-associated protein Cmr6
MRAALPQGRVGDHAGLAYALSCPPDAVRPKGDDELKARNAWLDDVVKIVVPDDYEHAHAAWRAGLVERAVEPSETRQVGLGHGKLLTPLLVGHGNASPTEVGLTLHHTWGVPMIPGSALKGLVAHYVAATYGPEATQQHPQHAEPRRARFQPPDRANGRVLRPPGDAYRHLFGAPDVDEGPTPRATGSAGWVVFHDALLDPAAASGPFLMHDVLTPHHKGYYEADDDKLDWPNEYEDPDPVPFVSVRPGLRFLFAVEGPPEWAELALWLLREALTDWGAGGKTARGYGRFEFKPDEDAGWLALERRKREDRRLPTLAPSDRWQRLVKRTDGKQLLLWAQEVFRDRKKRSPELEPLLTGHTLDADAEDEALRQALLAAGHVENWRTGRNVASLARSAAKLRELADAVDPPPPPPPTPEWRKKLDAVDPTAFDKLKSLADAARANPSEWPIEALDALLKRLRESLGKNPRQPKRDFVEEFKRYVDEQRRAARGGTP